MTDALDRLERIASEATPGKWTAFEDDDWMAMSAAGVCTDGYTGSIEHDYGSIVALTLYQATRVVCHDAGRWENDARLIALAPALGPAAALARAAQGALDRWDACLPSVAGAESAAHVHGWRYSGPEGGMPVALAPLREALADFLAAIESEG